MVLAAGWSTRGVLGAGACGTWDAGASTLDDVVLDGVFWLGVDGVCDPPPEPPLDGLLPPPLGVLAVSGPEVWDLPPPLGVPPESGPEV
ncbi:hypothetical protein [Saccharopolyspora thermophila]|uniref:hypothetical protein n=1 Tax=Saccharopolyspora thermophila TaxID=89367 RepID=UPI001E2E731D